MGFALSILLLLHCLFAIALFAPPPPCLKWIMKQEEEAASERWGVQPRAERDTEIEGDFVFSFSLLMHLFPLDHIICT